MLSIKLTKFEFENSAVISIDIIIAEKNQAKFNLKMTRIKYNSDRGFGASEMRGNKLTEYVNDYYFVQLLLFVSKLFSILIAITVSQDTRVKEICDYKEHFELRSDKIRIRD